jgi:hypothetical protein
MPVRRAYLLDNCCKGFEMCYKALEKSWRVEPGVWDRERFGVQICFMIILGPAGNQEAPQEEMYESEGFGEPRKVDGGTKALHVVHRPVSQREAMSIKWPDDGYRGLHEG